MLLEKIILIKLLVQSCFPFVFLFVLYLTGFLFGKLLIKYKHSNVGNMLSRSVPYVALIVFLLALVLVMINYTEFLFINLVCFSFFFGTFSKLKLKELNLIKVKGEVHSKGAEFYLGTSQALHNKYKYSLSDKVVKSALLSHHQLIYGASGSGKTFSTLQPQCYFDIKWGRRLFIIDPKGDIDFTNNVYSCAKNFGREDSFFFFSISNPKISHSFNPLLNITHNEIKDLIISCTEWSEPYYKKMAEMLLLEILEGMTLPTLSKIQKRIPDEVEFKGLKADLKIMCKSDFGKLIDKEDAPSLEDLHKENKICFFSLNTQSYPEASKQLGRIILGALMALSNKIQTTVPKENRKETTVIVDEFGSFITQTFITFLNKARSSKFRLILATQSPGDVELDGTKTRKQIADSTTIKIFLRVSDPESAEYCASVIGTHTVTKRTSRIDDKNFNSDTSTGSIRETQEFIIHPDDIKKLDTGEGLVYTQAPFSISRVKFDFSKYYKIPKYNYLKSEIANTMIEVFNAPKKKEKIHSLIETESLAEIKDNIAEFNI